MFLFYNFIIIVLFRSWEENKELEHRVTDTNTMFFTEARCSEFQVYKKSLLKKSQHWSFEPQIDALTDNR